MIEMKKALRFLPVVAAVLFAFCLGYLDAAKHHAHRQSESATNT
jgi:hypothetical protein